MTFKFITEYHTHTVDYHTWSAPVTEIATCGRLTAVGFACLYNIRSDKLSVFLLSQCPLNSMAPNPPIPLLSPPNSLFCSLCRALQCESSAWPNPKLYHHFFIPCKSHYSHKSQSYMTLYTRESKRSINKQMFIRPISMVTGIIIQLN